MLSLSQKNYSKSEVLKCLLYEKGSREISFRYDLLNSDDVKIGNLSTITGSISFSAGAQIKRTGSFAVTEYEYKDIDFLNDRVQPFFMLKMNGEWLEWPLGIFLISSNIRKAQNKSVTRNITAYDKNLILSRDRFENRYLIRKGSSYVNAIKQIIGDTGIKAVNIRECGAVLNVDKEFEIGSSKITALNELLRCINYTSCVVDGNGYLTAQPYIPPNERQIEQAYRDDELSILAGDAEDELDLFDAPNVFIRVVTNPESGEVMKASYINQNPASILSTVRRKRKIVDYEEITDIANQQTLQEYVYRIAFEKSQIYNKVRFTTARMPHHDYSDILFLEHSGLSISGKFSETNWSLDLKSGGLMTHEARQVMYV